LEGISFFPISVGKVYTKRGKGIKHRKSTKKVWQVYGLMEDYGGELLDRFTTITERETDLISLDPTDINHEAKFNRYATDYLNTTDRLLYLYNKKMIPQDVFDYFKHFVSFSKEHYDWKTSMFGEDVIKEKWKIVYDYLVKHNIESKSTTLPTSMYDFVATYKSKH